MKLKFFKYILLILFYLYGAQATDDLSKITEINLSNVSTIKKYNISSYRLISKSGKRLKEMKGTYLTQILNKELGGNEVELNNALFKAISKSGVSVTFTYNEISEKLAKIPVIIGYSDKIRFRDSIEISGFDGTNLSEKQKSKFDDIFTNFQVYRIHLQMKSIDKDTAANIFKNVFIVFPMDKNPDRWLGDLEKIEVYQLK